MPLEFEGQKVITPSPRSKHDFSIGLVAIKNLNMNKPM
jgi:hypothetical protein